MISVDDISKTIRKQQIIPGKKVILRNVSFKVAEGEILSIVGPNGAGKSTTIKLLLGFVRVSSGVITLRQGMRIGYLPENPYYYDYLTFRELLRFSARSYGIGRDVFGRMVVEVSRLVGLSDELDNRLRSFSKGMTQRAGLAAAIIHNPDMLILDEPMSGLDPVGRKMVFDLILDLQSRGKTVLFCSHILTDVERLCDKILIMDEGKIKRQLTREELLLSRQVVELMTVRCADVEKLIHDGSFLGRVVGDQILLEVETARLYELLDYLRAKNIKITGMNSPESILEKIFNDTVVRSC